MANSLVTINGLDELRKGLNAIVKKLQNPKDEFSRSAVKMKQNVNRHFESATGGDGNKWQSLKYREGQILRKTGDLQKSISSSYDSSSAVVGTNKVYAAIHNFGGKFKAWGKYPAIMPKREFMWLDDKTQDDIVNIFIEGLERA